MTCREMAEFLADYIGGELPAEVRVTFERHIEDCHNCLVFLDQYRATIVAGRTAYAELDREHRRIADHPRKRTQPAGDRRVPGGNCRDRAERHGGGRCGRIHVLRARYARR